MKRLLLAASLLMSWTMGTLSYGQCTADASYGGSADRESIITSSQTVGQSFKAGKTGVLNTVSLDLSATNTGCTLGTQDILIEILEVLNTNEFSNEGAALEVEFITSQTFTVPTNFAQELKEFTFDTPAEVTINKMYMIRASLAANQDCGGGSEPNLVWYYSFPTSYWASTGGIQFYGNTTASLGNTQKFATCIGEPAPKNETTPIQYEHSTAGNGNSNPTASISNIITTCQDVAYLKVYSDIYTGVWTGSSNYDYYVNGTKIGSNTARVDSFDISEYIPITSVKAVSNASTWSVVAVYLSIYEPTEPVAGPDVEDVTYELNETATPLTATLTGDGTTLKWYTTKLGGGYTTDAQTPLTTTVGEVNYYVAQADPSGCESARSMITVRTLPLPLKYGTSTSGSGGSRPTVELNFLSSCQEKVTLNVYNDIYNGTTWRGEGNYDYYVNGNLIGSSTELRTTYDISEYIPVTSVKAVSKASTWSSIGIYVDVYEPTTPVAGPDVVSPVNYEQNEVATQLDAILTGEGKSLHWYTSETGGGYSATAPTPSTAQIGDVSYYVSQADELGCESERVELTVSVSPVLGKNELENSTNVYPNPTDAAFNISLTEESILTIYDVSGVVVLQQKVAAGTTTVDGLVSGVYQLVINSNGTSSSQSLIVE